MFSNNLPFFWIIYHITSFLNRRHTCIQLRNYFAFFVFFIAANRVLGEYSYKPEIFLRDDVSINVRVLKTNIFFFFREMNVFSRKGLIIKHSYLSYRPEKFTYWHACTCIWSEKRAFKKSRPATIIKCGVDF